MDQASDTRTFAKTISMSVVVSVDRSISLQSRQSFVNLAPSNSTFICRSHDRQSHRMISPMSSLLACRSCRIDQKDHAMSISHAPIGTTPFSTSKTAHLCHCPMLSFASVKEPNEMMRRHASRRISVAMTQICSLYIINKSGGLIYQKSFAGQAVVDLNDRLRIASIWHSVCAIASQLSPIADCSGIHLLEADTFDLHCFQASTGTKFCLVVKPKTPNIPAFLNKLYELYSDYVLKNPFYEVEMPIRCELFDQHTELAVQRFPII